MTVRACEACGGEKEEHDFRLRKSVTTGLHYRGKVCRACHQATGMVWRRKNPDRVRVYNVTAKAKNPEDNKRRAIESHFRRKFGLTVVERDAMIAAQGGVCPICGTDTPRGKGWCVDHCHTTGKIRAILCQPCNLVLGHAAESPGTLLKAIEYLERHA